MTLPVDISEAAVEKVAAECESLYERGWADEATPGMLRALRSALTASGDSITPARVIEVLRNQNEGYRIEFLDAIHAAYCHHCGSANGFKCVCMKDE
jgi:hypothetical protein